MKKQELNPEKPEESILTPARFSCSFSKIAFIREREGVKFLVTFNNIINHIFLENII